MHVQLGRGRLPAGVCAARNARSEVVSSSSMLAVVLSSGVSIASAKARQGVGSVIDRSSRYVPRSSKPADPQPRAGTPASA